VHVNITAVAAVSIIAYDIFSGHQTDSSSQRVERDIEEKDSKKRRVYPNRNQSRENISLGWAKQESAIIQRSIRFYFLVLSVQLTVSWRLV
jgi:hypothetical protein